MSLLDHEHTTASPSYFWSCVTLSDECPFFSSLDPKLRYFGFGIALLYGVFMLVLLGDLNFFWALDNMQRQIDVFLNLVTNKLKRVEMDQRRLMSTTERTEKQLKRSEKCMNAVIALRNAFQSGEPNVLTTPSSYDKTEEPWEGSQCTKYSDY